MNTLFKTLSLTGLMAPLLVGAALAHGGSDGSVMGGGILMGDESMMGPGRMMGDYSEEQWQRFDGTFRDMTRLMERIHQTDDPEDHYRLMYEHMHELQDGMMMMGEGWRMGGPDNGGDSDDWDDRMRNMERQMFLMQQLLNQMIEREAAEYDEGGE